MISSCFWVFCCFFFKHKTAYELRISDWSSDVCSSDLSLAAKLPPRRLKRVVFQALLAKSAHRILLTAQGRLPILRDLSNRPHVFQEFHLGQYCQREQARPPVRESPRPQRHSAPDDPNPHPDAAYGHRRTKTTPAP